MIRLSEAKMIFPSFNAGHEKRLFCSSFPILNGDKEKDDTEALITQSDEEAKALNDIWVSLPVVES